MPETRFVDFTPKIQLGDSTRCHASSLGQGACQRGPGRQDASLGALSRRSRGTGGAKASAHSGTFPRGGPACEVLILRQTLIVTSRTVRTGSVAKLLFREFGSL